MVNLKLFKDTELNTAITELHVKEVCQLITLYIEKLSPDNTNSEGRDHIVYYKYY